MADRLAVRTYNVRFGDAILVQWPDRDGAAGTSTPRSLLLDVGNSLNKAGGLDSVFEPVVEDILRRLEGRPLDLYVMTHEHMDHVQGLPYVALRTARGARLAAELKPQQVWMTASADPDYRTKFPEAHRRQLALREACKAARLSLLAGSPQESAELAGLLAINDPTETQDCVDWLRGMVTDPQWVYRDCLAKHPFREATVDVWAPEENTADYYGRFRPAIYATAPGEAPSEGGGESPLPPPGVDAGAFYDLVALRTGNPVERMLAIDQAENNTSVVLCLEWRGWRLLFAGDAEQRSWKTMERERKLKPVHFLKVSHHASCNGTPLDAQLDAIFPRTPPDRRRRRAVVSTWPKQHSGVPDEATIRRLSERCGVYRTTDPGVGLAVELEFEG